MTNTQTFKKYLVSDEASGDYIEYKGTIASDMDLYNRAALFRRSRSADCRERKKGVGLTASCLRSLVHSPRCIVVADSRNMVCVG